jgi:hypothetical protein
MTTLYCLRFETPQPGAQVPVLYTPRYWVPFPLPFTTRRATVEVNEPTLKLWRASLLCLYS